MEISGYDGKDMSTLEMFDVPVVEDYNQNEVGMSDLNDQINLDIRDIEIEPLSDGMELNPLALVNGFARGDESQLDHPESNEVSDWVDDAVDDHMMVNGRSDVSLIAKGMFFATKELVLHACQRYSILNRVEFHTYKSDKDRLILACRSEKEKCAWHVRAVKKKKAAMWEITRYGGCHTCETNIIPKDNVHLNRHFIAMEIKDLIQKKLTLSPKAIKQIVSKKYGYDISYLKAWNARRMAKEFLFGNRNEPCLQLQNEQSRNGQPAQTNQLRNDQPAQTNQPRTNDHPPNDRPLSRHLNAHELSPHVRSLVRSGRAAADIFLNDPVPRTKKLAFDLFHASLADLVDLGEESALDIDPKLIQLHDDSSHPSEGMMLAVRSVDDVLHSTSQQGQGQDQTSNKKRKCAKIVDL